MPRRLPIRICALACSFFVVNSAEAACTITTLRPTGTLPTARFGASFSFVATNDCVGVSFAAQGAALIKVPTASGPVGSSATRYEVTLSGREWGSLTQPSSATFRWSVTGWDASDVVTRVDTSNELDSDRDGWTRSDGDVGECDFSRRLGPGATDQWDNGVDEDCDGFVDNTAYRQTVATIASRVSGAQIGIALTAGDVDGDGEADLQIGSWSANDGDGGIYLAEGPASGTVWVERDAVVELTPEPDGWIGPRVATDDVDADGVDDVLAGDVVLGRAYLFLGPITADRSAPFADTTFEGATDEPWGDDVDILSDFDGDGEADVAVGNPDYSESLTEQGAVYITPANAGDVVSLDSSATYIFEGGVGYESLGTWTSSIGDLDGDGVSDFATVGDVFRDERAYIVSGGGAPGTYDVEDAATAIVRTGGQPGQIVAADYDGDGQRDLIIGDSSASLPDTATNSGLVFAYTGPLAGDLSSLDAWTTWYWDDFAASLGRSVAADDIDGDGQIDVLMSSAVGEGVVFLQLGPTSGTVDARALPSLRTHNDYTMGTRVVTVPDWTGDGIPEIAVSASSANVGAPDAPGLYAGAVFVYGSDTLFQTPP